MAKVRKPGYRRLWKMYNDVLRGLQMRDEIIMRRNQEVTELQRKVTERVDTQMMAERVKLANALGQMMHTVTEATKFIIGKECL